MTDDGIQLYYEETGSGKAVMFVHEFSGDSRIWELQMRHFGRLYHTIAFNARGYPPSDAPEEMGECIRSEISRWSKVVKDANISKID